MTARGSSHEVNSWEGIEQLARKAGAKFPELVAAQWALESGWGQHESGKNNFFGLKGVGSEVNTQEFVNGAWITVRDGFIDFPSIESCVVYLVDRWYKDYKKFKGVNRAASRNGAARLLVEEQYATDPEYAEKLIELMEKREAVAVPQVVSDESKPVLFRLVAAQDTWLKKVPKPAAELGGNQKVAVQKGRVYGVCEYREMVGDAHALVEMGYEAGTWYVYEPHWMRLQASGEAVPKRVDWGDFDCLVVPSLTVGEVLQWDARRRPVAGSWEERNILQTAAEFQRVRDAWGGPLGVTSFYRPEPINQQVGGVKNSRHVPGKAMDIYPVGRSLEEFYQWIRVRWRGGLGDGRQRGFIHLDTDGGGFVAQGGVKPAAEWDY